MRRLDAAGCRHWSNALEGVLARHREMAQRRFDEGFEAGARACGPMCNRTGELKATELAAQVFEAGRTMARLADRLEALVGKEKP